IQNCDIQGVMDGTTQMLAAKGTLTIQNCNFVTWGSGVQVATESTYGTLSQILPRTTILSGDHFAAWPGATNWYALAMIYDCYTDGGILYGGTSIDLTQLDQVFVYDYQGVSGDNFQVWYYQQEANYLMPLTDTDYAIIASPEATRQTNAYNWAHHGVAI